jgi:hypothetical protein
MPKNKRRTPRPRKRQSSNVRRRATDQKTGQRARGGTAWIPVGGAVITSLVVAIVAIFVYQMRGGKGSASTATPPSVATAAPTLARRIDGIPCNNENISYHVHAHLQIVYEGQSVAVPANIGIDDNTCVYYLHTHDTSGELHIESPVARKFTLGNFFDIWGQPLSISHLASIALTKKQHLRAYLNGKRYVGNPRSIELTAHQLIALEVGPPFVRPAGFDFQGD